MKKEATKIVAGKVVSVLNTFLRVDANSASCIISYQPQAPKDLEKYKKVK